MSSELTKKIDEAFALCDELDNEGLGIGFGAKSRDALKADLMIFTLCFSMADGEISDEDVAFVNEVFGLTWTKEAMEGLYKTMCVDNIIYQDGDYSTKVPSTVQSYVAADKKRSSSPSVAEFVAGVYALLGKELFACNYAVSADASEKLDEFINRMYDYIKQ